MSFFSSVCGARRGFGALLWMFLLLGYPHFGAVAQTFVATGSLPAARDSHTATRLADGKVLVAGGTNGTLSLGTGELYNSQTGTWSATGAMTTPRSGLGMVPLGNGKVLVAGAAMATRI